MFLKYYLVFKFESLVELMTRGSFVYPFYKLVTIRNPKSTRFFVSVLVG